MNAIAVAVWMAFASPAALPPTPTPARCCGECRGTGMIPVNDPNMGGNVRVSCSCPPTCACVANRPKPTAGCANGQCPLPPRPTK